MWKKLLSGNCWGCNCLGSLYDWGFNKKITLICPYHTPFSLLSKCFMKPLNFLPAIHPFCSTIKLIVYAQIYKSVVETWKDMVINTLTYWLKERNLTVVVVEYIRFIFFSSTWMMVIWSNRLGIADLNLSNRKKNRKTIYSCDSWI